MSDDDFSFTAALLSLYPPIAQDKSSRTDEGDTHMSIAQCVPFLRCRAECTLNVYVV